MRRLTSNKNVSEMGMAELAYNSCYRGGDGWTRYRDYSLDIDARQLARMLLKKHADGDDAFTNDEDFEGWMMDYLQDGIDSREGLIALFYRNLWAMADLRERLKYYEDLEEQGKLPKLPCVVGDTVYTNCSMQDWYFRKENRPYAAKVVYIGVNGADNYINVDLKNGHMLQFKFSDIGKRVFITREDAEDALKEL